MKNNFLFFILILSAPLLFAQSYITVQPKAIALINATIHVGNGTVIENGILGFDKGKIVFAGDAATVRYDASQFEVVNVQGKHIYPGIIALNSFIGLKEIELSRATIDANEVGEMNTNVRSLISYNTDSRAIPTLRTNGILLAQVVPGGGIISGTSSVVELDAWNWEDASYVNDNCMHMQWPAYYTYTAGDILQVTTNKNYTTQINNLKTFFDEAGAYSAQKTHSTKNLKFEAMRSVLDGNTRLFIRANLAKEIIAAVQFAKTYNITPVIVGGAESYYILDFLKENNVSVILENIHRLPSALEEDIDMPYKLPHILQQAGILCAITLSNGEGYWSMRNIPFLAGTAAAYGLTKEEALKQITLNCAKILGIDKTAGSLETGKDATLIICEGDILDMKTSTVLRAFIRGREIDLNNWQIESYEKYARKYGMEIK